MIEQIEINNFKGIDSLSIEGVKKINFFIGGNNCHKTSILEAIALANIKNIREIIGNTKYNLPQEVLDSLFFNLEEERDSNFPDTVWKIQMKLYLKISYLIKFYNGR